MKKYNSTTREQMINLKSIIKAIQLHRPTASKNLIQRAYVLSANMHFGQKRKSGEPFLIHPLAVAKILTKLKLNEAGICAGLLHDTVEDTKITRKDISKIFGNEIADLVEGVTKLFKIKFKSDEERLAENFRKMLIFISKDIRVLLVKLADRLHNMRTMKFIKSEKQEEISTETIEIYAPLANRLGIGWMKNELENLSFGYLKPAEFKDLGKKVKKTKNKRNDFIKKVSDKIYVSLKNSGIKNLKVSGRLKHLWSIYRKMITKGLQFEDIHDLIAFRVIVESIDECYKALGCIHAIWKPVPGRFKDYIAMPKTNGYKSLHTTMIGSEGEIIEVQIKTKEMHMVAESGIAAHWQCEEKKSFKNLTKNENKNEFAWLTQLMNWQENLKDPNEFLDSVKADLFYKEIYVFTTKGDTVELPKGATVLDFAFVTRAEMGTRCFEARVNNVLVPLQRILKSGDACKIIAQKNQSPKKEWLFSAKTSNARTKIRSILRQTEREQGLKMGREILSKELEKYGITLKKIYLDKDISAKIKNQYETVDRFLMLVGYGKIDTKTAIELAIPGSILKKNLTKNETGKFSQVINKIHKKKSSCVKIEKAESIFIHYAKCCSPVKGDLIIGFMAKGRGLIIHRKNCLKVMELDLKRSIEATWSTDAKITRVISIVVITDDRGGMLADLATSFSRASVNILKAECKTFGNGQAISAFECEILDSLQLKKTFKILKSIKGVRLVERSSLDEEKA